MSRLRVGDDDHADAAGKHWEDVKVLADASPPRHDGAGYLSGYVVECTLKAVILHDKSYDPAFGTHDAAALRRWHATLSRRPYGHNLLQLAAELVGPEGARYMPDLPHAAPRASIFDWAETLRYCPPGAITEGRALSYREWAGSAYESILRMRADGVI